jgi:hypothetical protein
MRATVSTKPKSSVIKKPPPQESTVCKQSKKAGRVNRSDVRTHRFLKNNARLNFGVSAQPSLLFDRAMKIVAR